MNIGRFVLILAGCAALSVPVCARNPFSSLKAPPEQKQLYCAPILSCGSSADAFITNAAGAPVAGVNIKVNEELVATDSSGHASFTVPETEELVISTEHAAGTAGGALKSKYVRSGNYLVVQSLPASIAEAICSDFTPSTGKTPRLLFVPGAVEPGKEFVVTGVRLRGNSAENRLLIDGREAEVLASSTVCVLAKAPQQLRTGAVREIFLTSGGINSDAYETDVCQVDFSWPEKPDSDGAPQEAKLSVLGTYMPSVVEVINKSGDGVSFWLPDQKPMGRRGIFLTPGGEDNSIALQIRRATGDEPRAETQLIAEVPTGMPGEHPGIISTRTRHDLCKAQLIRLQRRLLSVQSRLEEARKDIDADSRQSDSLLAEMRVLSLRQIRIENMLQSRHALLLALGGSEDEYRQTLDAASGKTVANLELKIQLPRITEESMAAPPAIAAADAAGTADTTRKRGRLHRFIEPIIRLLPPMTDEERANAPPVESDKPAPETKVKDAAKTDVNVPGTVTPPPGKVTAKPTKEVEGKGTEKSQASSKQGKMGQSTGKKNAIEIRQEPNRNMRTKHRHSQSSAEPAVSRSGTRQAQSGQHRRRRRR